MTPAVAAHATAGVGVGAAPIEAAKPVLAASSVALPSLYVVNTGTENSTYGIRVSPIGKADGNPVPKGWVAITPATVALKPKAGTWVKLSLSVPAGAANGRYSSFLVAGTTAASHSAGTKAQFGSQAATRLIFTVSSPGAVSAAASKPDSSNGSGLGPWWAWVSGFALVAAAIAIAKSGIRVTITRG